VFYVQEEIREAQANARKRAMYAQPFDEFDPRALPNWNARFKTEAEFMAWVEDNNIPPETVARIAAAAQEQRTNARAIAEIQAQCPNWGRTCRS